MINWSFTVISAKKKLRLASFWFVSAASWKLHVPRCHFNYLCNKIGLIQKNDFCWPLIPSCIFLGGGTRRKRQTEPENSDDNTLLVIYNIVFLGYYTTLEQCVIVGNVSQLSNDLQSTVCFLCGLFSLPHVRHDVGNRYGLCRNSQQRGSDIGRRNNPPLGGTGGGWGTSWIGPISSTAGPAFCRTHTFTERGPSAALCGS